MNETKARYNKKLQLLSYIKEEKGMLHEKIIPQKNRVNIPLSFEQERLWFLDQLFPDDPSYNIPIALGIKTRINMHAFRQSLEEIVRRHETLRTRFEMIDYKPIQVIDEDVPHLPKLVDLEEITSTDKYKESMRIISDEFILPFNLKKDVMLRAKLILLDDEDNVLILTMHHIASDGWSFDILKRELFDLYKAFSNGYPSPLPKLPVQYTDYAVWQREWLSGEVLDDRLSYWEKQLSGLIPLEIPTDYMRPETKIFRGKSLPIFIEPKTAKKLKAIGQERGVTLYMILLSAFAILLYHYSGQEDITVGSPFANRNRKEIENLIGFFVNTLVMRTDLSGNPTFFEFVERIKKITLDAIKNQDIPFACLIEKLKPERDLRRNPFTQIAFSMQSISSSSSEMYEIPVTFIGTDMKTIRTDMEINLRDYPGEINGDVLYAMDLFDSSTISRLIKHFTKLLEELVDNPERHIYEIPILTKNEINQLLIEWNDTLAEYPKDRCIHDLFEEQVEITPDAVGLIFDDHQVTYKELNIRANQLAHYLRKRGVGPHSIVAIIENQTIEIIVSILGVLKSGAAYLPIDKENPDDRILFILKDSRANTLLIQSHIIKNISFDKLQNLQNVESEILVTPKREQIKDLDIMPIPDRSLVDYKKYDQYLGIGCTRKSISILATRGCPYKCAYCHKIWPKNHVIRSAQNIFQEVQYHYEKNGYHTFTILDDIFNLNRKNSEAFFNLVIQNNMKLRISFPNGLRGDILTPDYIDLMSEAGVMQIALALETASPRLQKLIGKNLDIERLRENILYICKKHSHIILDLYTMFGFPTESEEEALMTLDFIFGIKWLHFPSLHALKIFPNTDMEKLAIKEGIPKDLIEKSTNFSYHDINDTIGLSKIFAKKYQTKYLSEYFLNPERLNHVIAVQKKILTNKEMLIKYDGYLPGGLKNNPYIRDLIGDNSFYSDDIKVNKRDRIELSNEELKEKNIYSDEFQLNVLLLDLSTPFSCEGDRFANTIEAPLGLMYLLTYLNKQLGKSINGKIAKSFIDFDNYNELKKIIDEFHPHVIGVRTLSLYKSFYHETISSIKSWYPGLPIITGGPYATSEYKTILGDTNIDAVIIGEGELTLEELVREIIKNKGALPKDDVLEKIPGLAFLPEENKKKLKTSGINKKVIFLDKVKEDVLKEEKSNPLNVNHVNELAYVIYTSGTTGNPKGVLIEHLNVVRLLKNNKNQFSFTDNDVWTMFHSYSFDFAVWEMFGAIIYGGKLVIVDKEKRKDPKLFLDLLVKEQITILNQTPSSFNALLLENLNKPKIDLSLRYVIFGGEELHTDKLKEWKNTYPDIKIINMYGITETTVHVTFKEVDKNVIEKKSSNIGHPIPTTTCYIMDSKQQLLPVGVRGELCVGGEGVGRGYLNRSDLTAQKFVINPYRPEERVYCSGDLAKYLPNGDMIYLGRIDAQVKIRGYRIELGEIEAKIMEHPCVSEAIVIMTMEDATRDKRLAAYILPCKDQVSNAADIRNHLKERLPDYMIPSVFVFIDAIPLTPNGKVDYKKLPGYNKSGLEKEYVAPRTEIERKLVEMYSDILGIDKVGIYDDFFELGGHSLLATQVTSRIRDTIYADISVKNIFENSNVASLTEFIEQTLMEQEEPQEMDQLIQKIEQMSEEDAMQVFNTYVKK